MFVDIYHQKELTFEWSDKEHSTIYYWKRFLLEQRIIDALLFT